MYARSGCLPTVMEVVTPISGGRLTLPTISQVYLTRHRACVSIRAMTLDAAQSRIGPTDFSPGRSTQVMGRRWMVAAGHPLAAPAAARILDGRGNAPGPRRPR